MHDWKKMREVGVEHLHVHTDYSCLDGLSQVEEYAERCGKINQKFLCVSDHGMMGVIPRQIRAAEKTGLTPIFACELYVNNLQGNDPKDFSPEEKAKYGVSPHLLAIAYNQAGYSNLVQLCSWGWLSGFYRKPRVTYEQLLKHRDGIFFTSCCYNSEVGRAFDSGGAEAADQMIERYIGMFGDNYFLELMLLDFAPQKAYDAYLVGAAERFKRHLIVTQDCHYCNKSDSRLQQYMLMIRTKRTIKEALLKQEAGEDVFELQDTNLWLKSEAELNEKWAADFSDIIPLEVFERAKMNTVELCRRAKGVELDRTVKLPQLPDADNALWEAVKDGFRRRPINRQRGAEYMARVKEEYDLIRRKGFASYFLICKMFTDEARRVCPQLTGFDSDCAVGPARGSGAAALTNFLLGVTDVDPIEEDLMFSRFLNENRGGRRMKVRFTAPPLPGPLVEV